MMNECSRDTPKSELRLVAWTITSSPRLTSARRRACPETFLTERCGASSPYRNSSEGKQIRFQPVFSDSDCVRKLSQNYDVANYWFRKLLPSQPGLHFNSCLLAWREWVNRKKTNVSHWSNGQSLSSPRSTKKPSSRSPTIAPKETSLKFVITSTPASKPFVQY